MPDASWSDNYETHSAPKGFCKRVPNFFATLKMLKDRIIKLRIFPVVKNSCLPPMGKRKTW